MSEHHVDSLVTATILMIAGFILLFIGLIVAFLGSLPIQKIEGGGIILIGPLPIIITGEGQEFISTIVTLLLLAIFVAVIIFIIVRLMHRQTGPVE
ncbi:MAG: DUF131 domain-containing protein [Nitrososphaerota archaeon]